eukprot:285894-Amphidinium_carterae.1
MHRDCHLEISKSTRCGNLLNFQAAPGHSIDVLKSPHICSSGVLFVRQLAITLTEMCTSNCLDCRRLPRHFLHKALLLTISRAQPTRAATF